MKPIPLAHLLDQATKKMGLGHRLRQGLAVEIWPRVVGPEIARQTAAGPVKDRVMIVRTANPVLAHQLNLMQQEIMHRYQKTLGKGCLRSIHIHVGEIPVVSDIEPWQREKRRDLTEAEAKRISDLSSPIPLEELSAVFRRVLSAWTLARSGQEEGADRVKSPNRP